MIDFEIFNKKDKSPDLTPMIDMVFLLLIFFLLTSVFRVPAIETELPASSSAASVKPEEFVVSIKDDGGIFFNDKKISKGQLEGILKCSLETSSDKNVSIASDKSVSFENIVSVMDIAKSAGALSVSFLTEDEE